MAWRRWTKQIAAGVAIGACVTIAIAWYIAIATGPAKGGVRTIAVVLDQASGTLVRIYDEPRGYGYHLRLASGVTPTPTVSPARAMLGGLPTVERPGWLPLDFSDADTLREEHVGWPLLALKSGYGTRTVPGVGGREVHFPAMAFQTATTTYTLPLAPMWGGFLANIAIFAAVYIGIATAIDARRRGRVGRCGHCMYSLRGLPEGAVCPECGTPQVAAEPIVGVGGVGVA